MVKQIHFVTGKGGVGKSLIAAGLALREARSGKRVLLVEFGERSFYKEFFNLKFVGYKPTPFLKNLDIALWTGREALREYATHLIKVEALTRLFFENPVSRSLIDIAPALTELALLGKATSGPRKHGPAMDYEVIVIDAFATGHFLALLRAPRGLSEAIRFGPMGEQSRSIIETLKDETICKTHIVCLPEEMPVKETEELTETLEKEFKIHPELIFNKWIETPSNIKTNQNPFAEFLKSTQERQKEMEKRLQATGRPLQKVSLMLEDDPQKILEKISEALS